MEEIKGLADATDGAVSFVFDELPHLLSPLIVIRRVRRLCW